MNGWLIAATIVIVLLLPCLWVTARHGALEGVVAIELAGVLASTGLLLLSEGFHRQPFADLALVLGVLSFVGSLAYLRFIGEARR